LLPLFIAPALRSLRREKAAAQVGLVANTVAYLILALSSETAALVVGFVILGVGRALVLNVLPSLVATINATRGNRNDLDTWMTRLYMFSNAGSFIGPAIAGALVIWRVDYRLIFLISALASAGCLICVSVFCSRWHPGLVEGNDAAWPAGAPPGQGNYAIVTLLVVTAFSVIFWAGFETKSGPLNEFAEESVDRSVGDFVIPTGWFQSVSPFFVVLLAWLFDYMWRKLDSRRRENPVSPLAKQAAGLAILSGGFWVLYWAQPESFDADDPVKMSWQLLVFVYLLHTIGELLLEPIGQSLVLKLAPRAWQTFFLSVWNASTAAASLVAGMYQLWWHGPGPAMWFGIGCVTLLAAVALFVLSPILTSKCRRLIFE
jgi:POT family proton-dependent oligopeptide transporter